MFNPNRIKLMTALALYEEGEGKDEIKISNYKQKDYVGLHMLTTAIMATVGYLALVGLVCVMMASTLLKSLSSSTIIAYGIIAAIGYVLFLTVCLVYAYTHFVKKHKLAKKHAKTYFLGLRRLNQMYKVERQKEKQQESVSELRRQIEGEED